MKQARVLMGMTITVEVVSDEDMTDLFDDIYDFLADVDSQYSPYKPDSLVSRIDRGELEPVAAGEEMESLLLMADLTRQQTADYFNVWHNGHFDPSGIVKGWAIYKAAAIVRQAGFTNCYVDAGGDVQVYGHNPQGELWRVGIRNPFDSDQVVKILAVTDCGVATSGFYQRGRHIYNPHQADDRLDEIVSLTVIGPNVFEADRFATAAFAMGRDGLAFIESRPGLEGYMIDRDGIATLSSGLGRFLYQKEFPIEH